MATEPFSGTYGEKIVAESMREFNALQTYRAIFAAHWEEVRRGHADGL